MFAYAFIGINVLIFIFQAMMGPTQLEQFIMNYGSIPADISHGNHLFTLFTSMFLHGGWMHLIGNMLFLWVFADNIEAVIGNFNFILFYLIGGLAAALAHVVRARQQYTSCGGKRSYISGIRSISGDVSII